VRREQGRAHGARCTKIGNFRSSDRFEHQLIIERFRKELDRTLSHRLNPRPGVSVSSNEDDRDIAILFFQPGLQLTRLLLRPAPRAHTPSAFPLFVIHTSFRRGLLIRNAAELNGLLAD
jgi:hypothetical protein